MTQLHIRRTSALVGSLALAVGLVVVPLAQPASAQVIAQSSVVSADPANFTPNVIDGKVEAFAQVGSWMIAAGSFTQVQASTGGAVLTRNNIFAFNPTTGAISTTFAPNVAGEVYDVEPATDGTSVYVVGSFTQAAGSASSRVARLNVTSGAKVAGFVVPTINGVVKNVDLTGGKLLIGGAFTSVGGSSRNGLASLDPNAGTLTSFLNLPVSVAMTGPDASVLKMAVAPNGNRAVVIGNFTMVAGQPRQQIAMIDLTGATAALANWSTDFYQNVCNPVFYTYMRDLDFAPDSSYFVVSTTGAYGGENAPCDVISRWETGATGSGQTATWRDYTGGDTTYAVAVTGTAVYVGGHMRWLNNPYAGDAAGPGAVPREGIAALDPTNGLPLSWNPGRDRGVGVFDMLATSAGLWIGSDTDHVAGETRRKLAFFPLAGGATIPPSVTGTVPNDVYLLGRTGGAADPNVLYRVDAGGPALQSADDGPDWISDDEANAAGYKAGQSNQAGGYPPVAGLDPSVPQSAGDRAATALFQSESWGGDAGNEMAWHFPVPANTPVTVRLYLANQYSGTAQPGQRVYDISVEGGNQFPNFDPAAVFGNQVGGMKSVDVVSNGSIDITFTHHVENPLINGIEIIKQGTGGGGGGITAADDVQRRYFTGSTVGPNTVLPAGTTSWGLDRGSFLLDNTLYTGWADGTFSRRTFNGTTFGAPTAIPLYGSSFAGDVGNLTGIVYANNRIYYTLFGQSDLFWRYFTPQSGVVGAVRNTAGGNVGELNPGRVQGMFLSGTSLYAADRSSGDLVRVTLSGTDITGTATTVDSTNDWQARGAFLWNGTPAAAPNTPPTAAATADCPAAGGLTCTFGSAGSTDTDGTINARTWTFDDGGTATGASPTHTFASAGSHSATLTVTDDRGGQDTDTVTFTVVAPPPVPPVASFTSQCTNLACTFNGTASNDPDGGALTYAWDFADTPNGTASTVSPAHTFSAAGTYTVSLTVTDNEGQTNQVTHDVTVTAASATSITYRSSAVANTNATSTAIPTPAGTVAGDALLLFVSSNTGAAPASTPTGWTLVGDRLSSTDLRTTLYTRAYTSGTLGTVSFGTAVTKTQITVLAYSGAVAVPTAFASVAKTAASTSYATPGAPVSAAGSWVVSFWAMKASTAPTWTAPAGTTQRAASAGTGGGLLSGLAADAGPVSGSSTPAVTATATVSSAKGTGWTVVLQPKP